MKNIIDELLLNIKRLQLTEVPESVINRSKSCFLDYLGATLAGTKLHINKTKKLIMNLEDAGNSTLIGFNIKTNVQNAIFINALCSHFADMDDGSNNGIIHLASPIISTVLPIVESKNIKAYKFLKSIIIGYEVALAIATTIQPRHKELGYHATGTCGVIGATVALSYIFDLTDEEMKTAISAATLSSSGTLKALEDNSDLKPYNVANAAVSAYYSVQIGYSGFNAPIDAFGGNRGFFSIKTDNKINVIDPFIKNGRYAVERVYYKPYAACRYCHPPIEATINLKKKYNIDFKTVKEITVNTYYWAVFKHDHCVPEGITSAKMSIPFSVAVALIFSKAGINEFVDRNIADKEIIELSKKVKVVSNDDFTKQFPNKCISEVLINTGENKYVEVVDNPKGEPENPLSREELELKFKELATFGGKTEAESKKIIDCVWDLENRLDELYTLI